MEDIFLTSMLDHTENRDEPECVHCRQNLQSLQESSCRFRNVPEVAQDAIIINDKEGRIAYWNPAAEKLFGYTRAEVLGRDFEEVLRPQGARMGKPLTIEAPETVPKKYNLEHLVEMPVIRKDGTKAIVEVSTSVMTLGRHWYTVGFLRDLTRRKALEQALITKTRKLKTAQQALIRQNEDLRFLNKKIEIAKNEWEKTMDCIEEMVLLLDGEENIKRINGSVRHFTGKPYEQILGSNWKQLLFKDVEDIESYCKGMPFFHVSSGKWFLLNHYPLQNTQVEGEPNSVVVISDATELKRITTELEEKNKELNKKRNELEKAYSELKATQAQILQQEKMASIGQLAAGIAHEINNPIGFVSSNLCTLGKYIGRFLGYIAAQQEMIESLAPEHLRTDLEQKRKELKIDHITGDIKELISESMEGTERVKKIVQDLKSFSRVDQAELQHVDINECLESTINIVWNELKYKATVHKEYGELVLTKCYPQQLNQVFVNLLINAVQAIEKQGEITIKSWQEQGSILVSISDTGCGIPAKNLNRIFEPFFTTKEVGKGTGLGLSITYDIVKKHKGDIVVHSEPGKGTTFTVKIPIVEGR